MSGKTAAAEVDLDEAMRRKRARPRMAAIRKEPAAFVGKRELAHHLQGDVSSIGDWIVAGTIPPPWYRTGDKHPLWKREHFDHLVKTGAWPKAAFHGRAV